MSVFRKGASALITGGSSGIGLAVAQLCLKHGMRVALVDVNTKTLDLAKDTLSGGEVEYYEADVSKKEDWDVLREKIDSRFGSDAPDLLMLNAGVGTKGTWGNVEYFQKVRTYAGVVVQVVGASLKCTWMYARHTQEEWMWKVVGDRQWLIM
jgi:NAD(P)-dependent dehydrogenase (short-subunit alcohol dehydrogenase family)